MAGKRIVVTEETVDGILFAWESVGPEEQDSMFLSMAPAERRVLQEEIWAQTSWPRNAVVRVAFVPEDI